MLTEKKVQELGLNNLSAADQSAHILYAATEFLVLLNKFDEQSRSYEDRAKNIVKIVRQDIKSQGLSEDDKSVVSQFFDANRQGQQSQRELIVDLLEKASAAKQQKQELIKQAKTLSPEHKALFWPIVATIKMPEAIQQIVDDIFYDEAGHQVFKDMTRAQREDISDNLKSTASPLLKKTRQRLEESRIDNADEYDLGFADDQDQSFVFRSSEVQELLRSDRLMAETRDKIAKIYSPIPPKYNFASISASDRQGIADLRNFHLACSLPSMLGGAIAGLPHDALYNVLTFVGPEQAGVYRIRDLLNQEEVSSLRGSRKKFAKAHALIDFKKPVLAKKPSVSFASRWLEFKNIFSCLSPDQIFFMAISFYLMTLSILFEVPEMLFLPALIMLGLFLGTLFVNNFWGMKTMAENFVKHDFGFAANAIALSLSAIAGFAAIYFNIAWLMALPALALILVVVRPVLASYIFDSDEKVMSDAKSPRPLSASLFETQASLSEIKKPDDQRTAENGLVTAKV